MTKQAIESAPMDELLNRAFLDGAIQHLRELENPTDFERGMLAAYSAAERNFYWSAKA